MNARGVLTVTGLCILSACGSPEAAASSSIAEPATPEAMRDAGVEPGVEAESNEAEGSDRGADGGEGSDPKEPSVAQTTDDDPVCERCSGPGDWVAGDYPPELRKLTYLPIEGVAGQKDNVRGYKVHVPKGYDPNAPTPLLFALHGIVQNAVMFAVEGADWPAKSDAEGFILVMPSGDPQQRNGRWALLGGSWNGGECCGSAAVSELDDVALIRAILDEVAGHVNVDFTRVYATGLSNGAFLSYRLACEASDLFAAVAPASGGVGIPQVAPMGAGNKAFTDCVPTHPVAVLATHGTADPLVPYAFYKPSLEVFAEANGCTMNPTAATTPASGGDTTCVTYPDCAGGVEVTGCSVDRGGHCWFGSKDCGTGDPTGVIGPIIVGNNSDTLVNNDAIWAFLERFSRK